MGQDARVPRGKGKALWPPSIKVCVWGHTQNNYQCEEGSRHRLKSPAMARSQGHPHGLGEGTWDNSHVPSTEEEFHYLNN
jgi:hypothetical protein